VGFAKYGEVLICLTLASEIAALSITSPHDNLSILSPPPQHEPHTNDSDTRVPEYYSMTYASNTTNFSSYTLPSIYWREKE